MRKASHPRSSLKVVSEDYGRIMNKRQYRRSRPWYVSKRCYLTPPTKQQMRAFDLFFAGLAEQFVELPGDAA